MTEPASRDSVPEPRVTVKPPAARSSSSDVAVRLVSSPYVLPLAENDWTAAEVAGAATSELLVTAVVAAGTVVPMGLDFALVPAAVVSVAAYPYTLGSRTGVVKLQAPVLLAVVVPSSVPVVLHTVTVELATAVPFRVMESFGLTAMLLMVGVATVALVAVLVVAGTVTPSAFDFALVPADVVSVAAYPYTLGSRTGVVKLQAPVLLAVVVPSSVPVVLHTVTVELATAVPFRVMESLEFTAMLLMTGAATATLGTVTSSAVDFALLPADVVSVAVNA